jgi:hypothetical protein
MTPDLALLAVAVIVILAWFTRQPIRAVAGFAAFMLFIDNIAQIFGPDLRFTDEVVVPGMVLITIVRQRSVIPSRIRPVREAAVVVLVIAALASSLVAGVPGPTWLLGMGLLLKGMAVFYAVLMQDVGETDVRWVARLFLGIGIVVLAVGALQLIAPDVLSSLTGAPRQPRAGVPVIGSVFYHPELFGWLCAVISLYLTAAFVATGRRWMLVLALLFSAGTILSARRRSILGLVAGVAAGVAFGAIGQRRRLKMPSRRWMAAGAATAVLLVAFLPALMGLYALTIQSYGQAGSGSPGAGGGGPSQASPIDTPARLALYETSVRIAVDRFPLGVGLGRYGSWLSRTTYSDVYRQYGLDRIYGLSPANPGFITDTFWPQILGEAGVIGAVAYLVFLASIGFELWNVSRRQAQSTVMRWVALGALLLFVETAVETIASPILNSPSQAYLVMLGFAATLGLGRIAPSAHMPSGVDG